MTYDLLPALVAFAFVTTGTPGPNVMMLIASGANFGFRRTLPHMLGIGLGFTTMIVLVGIGLARLFEAVPWLYTALLVVSVAYLLYLAWRIATAAPAGDAKATGRPMTFLQAAAFQWVNPKAWTMALGAVTLYAPDQSLPAILLVAAVFGIVLVPCASFWTVFGREMRPFLTGGRRLTLFNRTMAVLLVASLLPGLLA